MHAPFRPQRIAPHPLVLALAVAFTSFALASAGVQAQVNRVKPPSVAVSTQMTADSIAGSLEENVVLQGGVTIERGTQKMTAPKVEYSALTDEAKASGGVILFQNKDVFRAPAIQLNLATEAGSAANVDFFYSKYNARGTAQNLQMSPSRVHTLSETRYTTCKPGQTTGKLPQRA